MNKAKTVTTLEGLEVHEVSIVDRPANLRPFLIVKSETGPELEVDASGNLTTSKVVDEPATATAAPVEKVEPVAPALEPTVVVEVEKRLSIDPELRSLIFSSLGSITSRLNTVLYMADVAQSSNGEPSTLQPILAQELAEVAKAIADVAKKFSNVSKAEDVVEIGEALATIAKRVDGIDAMANGKEPVESELEEALKSLMTTVEKRGAKMAKGRLNQFKNAIELLGKILGELQGDGVEKAIADSSEVESLRKQVEARDAEIARLKAPVARSSNALPVEKANETEVEESASPWPYDMNDREARQIRKSGRAFDLR
jgi:hypothetical protein